MKTTSLDRIMVIASSKEHDAALDYSNTMGLLDKLQQQRQELDGYLSEYYQSIESKHESIELHKITNTRMFIARIENILNQQDKAILSQKNLIEKKYRKLIECRRQRELLEKMIDRKRARNDSQLSRNEQKLLDEIAGLIEKR